MLRGYDSGDPVDTPEKADKGAVYNFTDRRIRRIYGPPKRGGFFTNAP